MENNEPTLLDFDDSDIDSVVSPLFYLSSRVSKFSTAENSNAIPFLNLLILIHRIEKKLFSVDESFV